MHFSAFKLHDCFFSSLSIETRLPASQAFLNEVIVVRRQRAAKPKGDQLPMDLVRFGDTVAACFSNKIAYLRLRQLVKAIACRLQQVPALSLSAHQIRACTDSSTNVASSSMNPDHVGRPDHRSEEHTTELQSRQY